MADINSHEEAVAAFREINENLTKVWGLWEIHLKCQERLNEALEENAKLRARLR